MTHHDNEDRVKSANQGTVRIWVGFAYGHPFGTLQTLNSKTYKINFTHYLTFMQKSYGEDKVKKPAFVEVSDGRSDDGNVDPDLLNNMINNIYNDVSDDICSDEKVEANLFEHEIKNELNTRDHLHSKSCKNNEKFDS